MQYSDFHVRLDEIAPDEVAVVGRIDGRAMRETVVVQLSAITESVASARSRELSSKQLAELGAKLAGILLPGELRLQMMGAWQAKRPIRITVEPGTPRLATLPWELVWLDRGDGQIAANFLALSDDISIVRTGDASAHIFGAESSLVRATVLAVDAGQASNFIQPLKRQSADYLADQLGQETVVARLKGQVTWNEVLTTLGNFQASASPSIFHFSGHGTPNPPRLIFGGDQARDTYVSPEDLAAVLPKCGVQLAVFACCWAGSGDEWSGLGAHLVGAGVPAIISMQSLAEDIACDILSVELYKQLNKGLSIEESLACARRLVKATADLDDWWIAMLHTRSPERSFVADSAPHGDDPSTDLPKSAPATDLVNNLPSELHQGPFLGRSDERQAISNTIRFGVDGSLQILLGLGGVGKSELANRCTQEALDDGLVKNVWRVEAENVTAMTSSLVALAKRLGDIHVGKSDLETAEAVRRHLEVAGNDDWLLVFDNAHSMADIEPYVPKKGVHVLITTRNAAGGWPVGTEPILVEALTVDDATDVLLALLVPRASEDKEAVEQLAEAVFGIPLALRQAAAYINESGRSVHEYLQMLARRPGKLLSRSRNDREQTIGDVVAACFGELSPRARHFFTICAWLDPDAIDFDLFASAEASKILWPHDGLDIGDLPFEIDELVGELRRYSLVGFAGNGISIHRLVQQLVRDYTRSEGADVSADEALDEAAKLLLALAPAERWKIIGISRSLATQLTTVGRLLLSEERRTPEAADLLHRVSNYHRQKGGDLQFAQQACEYGFDLALDIGYVDSTAGIAHTLQSIYVRLLGESNSAGHREATIRRALDAIPENDPLRANLSALLIQLSLFRGEKRDDTSALGELAEAFAGLDNVPLDVRVSTILAIHQSYRYSDRHDLALEIAGQLFEELPENAPDDFVVRTLGSMALAESGLGDTVAAARHAQQVVEILESGPWSRSFELPLRLNNLAIYQARLGDFDAAIDNLSRALEINKMLQPDSATVSMRSSNLGGVFLDAGRLAEAEVHLEAGVSLARQWDQNGLYIRLRKLADLRIRQGRVAEAEVLVREARDLPHGRSESGMMIREATTLAHCLLIRGAVDEAADVLADVERDWVPYLNDKSVARAKFLEIQSRLRSAQNRPEDAQALWSSAEAMYEVVGGAANPDLVRMRAERSDSATS